MNSKTTILGPSVLLPKVGEISLGASWDALSQHFCKDEIIRVGDDTGLLVDAEAFGTETQIGCSFRTGVLESFNYMILRDEEMPEEEFVQLRDQILSNITLILGQPDCVEGDLHTDEWMSQFWQREGIDYSLSCTLETRQIRIDVERRTSD